MTDAARKILDAIEKSWDMPEQYATTAERGLSEADLDALAEICDETGDAFGAAEAEVLAVIRSR